MKEGHSIRCKKILNFAIVTVLPMLLGGSPAKAEENFCAEAEDRPYFMPGVPEYEMLAKRIRAITDAKDANALCEVSGRKDSGDRLVHAIAKTGDSDLLHTLLRKGADINARNQDGNTALMLSTSKTMSALMVWGADPFVRNSRGRDVVELMQPLLRLLEREGLAQSDDYRALKKREDALIQYMKIYREKHGQ
jgi:ankyrin repeat protein